MKKDIDFYKVVEMLFYKMLPDYTGHEKQLELLLINASNKELLQLAIDKNITIE